MSGPSNLLRTPLYDHHVASGARMVPFGGWEMPLSYQGQLAEHEAVRSKIGVFDVSHMGQVRITGSEAVPFLQWLVPGNIASLSHGGSRYTQLVNESGGILDDLILSRLGDQEFFAVVNAATREKDILWMKERAAEKFPNALVDDESKDWAMIAVQGPESLVLLDKLIPAQKWSATRAFTLHKFDSEGEVCYLSRTGYTGEIGAELLVPPALAELWQNRLETNGAIPCGLAARDSLRLEAGYCLYGQDITEEITPIEANLGWSVSLKKPEQFIGRSTIEKQKLEGAPRKLVGLQAETRRPLRLGDEIHSNGAAVGTITSGGYSPALRAGVALAIIHTEALDQPLEVISRGKGSSVKIVKPPFVETSLSKSK